MAGGILIVLTSIVRHSATQLLWKGEYGAALGRHSPARDVSAAAAAGMRKLTTRVSNTGREPDLALEWLEAMLGDVGRAGKGSRLSVRSIEKVAALWSMYK